MDVLFKPVVEATEQMTRKVSYRGIYVMRD